MKGVACFGFDTRIYISNVLARLSPFLRFDSRLRNIKRDPFTSFSWRDRDRNRDRGNSANHVRSLSSLLRSKWNYFEKKEKKKRKNAYVIGTYVIETITIQYVRRWMRNMRLTSRCPCQNVFDISLKVYK